MSKKIIFISLVILIAGIGVAFAFIGDGGAETIVDQSSCCIQAEQAMANACCCQDCSCADGCSCKNACSDCKCACCIDKAKEGGCKV